MRKDFSQRSDDMYILRRQIRQRRRKLTHFARAQAAMHVTQRAITCAPLRQAQHIGIYLAAFGEVPTLPLMKRLQTMGKRLYLPSIVGQSKQLRWQRINLPLNLQRMARHRLGMRQAMRSRAKLITHLDCVVMPLVLFDEHGQRVGMGGGFYDQTLAHAPYRPYRIGLAYDFQKTAFILKQQPWDQPVNAIITPTRLYTFKKMS